MRTSKLVYISIPITGRDLPAVLKELEETKEKLKAKGYEIITPFDLAPDSGKTYAYYMGKDIEGLLEADIIYLSKGWQNSKGCMAEFEVARVFNKQIICHGDI